MKFFDTLFFYGLKMKIRLSIVLIIIASLAGMLYFLIKDNDTREINSTITVADAMTNRGSDGFARAIAPRTFKFPEDHGPHPEFRTEWWYYTGNLETDDGKRFGFQFTLFRNAISPDSVKRASNWASNQIYMGHFALTDVANKKFYAYERFSRGAAELAGAQSQPFRVWLEDWSVAAISAEAGDQFPDVRIQAKENGIALNLKLANTKPVVLQGNNGLSQKGPEPGDASYYYSLTRLAAEGTIQIDIDSYEVTGLAWLDREWSTSALGSNQIGWDWFSLQLDDGREIMYYQIRKTTGEPDSFSSGTLIDKESATYHLKKSDVSIQVLSSWRSPIGGTYPARWQLSIPRERIVLELTPLIPDQELNLSIRYWEGAVKVAGVADGKAISGNGYVELTGYADAKN